MDGIAERQGEQFSREDRLRRRREFQDIYSRGVRISGRHFTLFILPNKVGRSRLGVTLSRKAGNAVVRNRTRRRLREIFRKRRGLRDASIDIVVHARPAIAGAPLAVLEAELLEGFARFQGSRKGST